MKMICADKATADSTKTEVGEIGHDIFSAMGGSKLAVRGSTDDVAREKEDQYPSNKILLWSYREMGTSAYSG